MSALLLLRAVPAASLLAVPDALGVQRAADDLVAHAREVLHAAAAHEHHRVLLQVVADARDVGGHLDATGEADTSDLPQRRVRLLRRGRVHAGAHPAALRGTLQRRGLGLLDLVLAALADQLVDRGHGVAWSSYLRWVVLSVWCCARRARWCRSCSGLPRPRSSATVRPPRSGVSPFPWAGRCRRTGLGRPSRLGAAPPPAIGREVVPDVRNRTPRRTANGSRPRAPWAQLTTIPAPNWPVQTGSPSRLRALGHTRGAGSSG